MEDTLLKQIISTKSQILKSKRCGDGFWDKSAKLQESISKKRNSPPTTQNCLGF